MRLAIPSHASAMALHDRIDLMRQDEPAHGHVTGPSVMAWHTRFDGVVDAAEEDMDLLADRAVQLGGTAEGTVRVTTTRTGLEAYPLTRAEERCSMQLVTMAECFAFFSSIAVILYLWIQ